MEKNKYPFLAENVAKADISLYRLKVPKGVFINYKVNLVIYFFEKNGTLTPTPKAYTRDFHKNYFNDCYNEKQIKKPQYILKDIVKVLNTYLECVDPNTELIKIDPTLQKASIVVYGGITDAIHLAKSYRYQRTQKGTPIRFGIGGKFFLQKNIVLGLNLDYKKYSGSMFFEWEEMEKQYDINIFSGSFLFAYDINFGKLSFQPGVSIGIGKVLTQKEEVGAFSRHNAYYLLLFDNPVYNFSGGLEVEYLLTSK